MTKISIPYPATSEAASFEKRTAEFIRYAIDERLSHFQTKNNALVLRHGLNWESTRDDGSRHESALEEMTAESAVKWEAIINNDTVAFRESLDAMIEQFVEQMSKKIYRTVESAATEVGNVVSLSEAGSLAQGFLDMLEGLEHGVDERGNVTLPSLHGPPARMDAMAKELAAQGPDFSSKVEAIKTRKSAEAIEREQERLARYVTDSTE